MGKGHDSQDEGDRLDELAKRCVALHAMCKRSPITSKIKWCAARCSAAFYAAHSWPVLGERMIGEAEAIFERLAKLAADLEIQDIERSIRRGPSNFQWHRIRVQEVWNTGAIAEDERERLLKMIAEANEQLDEEE